MAPPLSKYQLEILNTEFYTNLQFFGRDKLYNILRQKYPDKAISRRQISEWLSHQEINQLYHPSKGKPKSIKSSMTTPNTILAIDLVNMEKFEVRNFKYLLNCIDMGSRFVYSQAMKNKTDTEVLKAFKKIYTQSNIRAIRSDNGSEFINNKFVDFLEKNDIKQILSEAGKPQSNGMIERANSTIKELIQKSVELNQNFDWVKNLQKLIDNINNSQHRITGFTPNQIQEAFKNEDTELLNKANEKELKKKKGNLSKQEFKIRDLVRLHQPSDKTRQVWSNKIYTVEKVFKPQKIYSVYEYKLREFKDRFKEEELLRVYENPQNKILNTQKFSISKLIKPIMKDDIAYYEVKWKGYNETTQEPREVLLKDVPKMVNQFEKKEKITFYENTNKTTGKKTQRFNIN
jgi:transposase InsO family protein